MMDHEVVYERNLTKSYMKISAVRCEEFDEKILLKRKLKGLLAMELSFYNGHPWYWYNISGKQSLDTYCRIQNVGLAFIEKMIASICDEIEILEWNLLSQNCLVLDPEYIFISNLNQEIIFTAYPGNKADISGQVQELLEYLLTKIDHSDMEAVQTGYALYERSLDQAYSLADLRDVILMRKGGQEADRKSMELPEGMDSGKPPEAPAAGTRNAWGKGNEAKPAEAKRAESKGIGSRRKELHGIEDEKKEAISAFESIKRKILEWLNSTIMECRNSGEAYLAQKGSPKKREVLPAPIVYPDEPEREPQPQIHPTVCLTSYRAHPKGMLLYEGGEKFSDIQLGQDEKKVGKSEKADVKITKDTISQFHAKIDYEDEEYFLEDLNSTNGTFVNEEPLAYKERRKLKSDDIVRFADVRFRFI